MDTVRAALIWASFQIVEARPGFVSGVWAMSHVPKVFGIAAGEVAQIRSSGAKECCATVTRRSSRVIHYLFYIVFFIFLFLYLFCSIYSLLFSLFALARFFLLFLISLFNFFLFF